MNEVNRTLFIPLYGKARVSRQRIILDDPSAEQIWKKEAFPIHGKSASKWLAYNMAMRARVFDDWTDLMLSENRKALILHIGCGLDSRCRRVSQCYENWIDCDFPEVITVRKKYYTESDNYHMMALDAADPRQISSLPDSDMAVVVLEGISMYLTNAQLHNFFHALQEKYSGLHILMDVYTEFGAKMSKYKNPVNDVGVTKLYGVDNIQNILEGLRVRVTAEHSLTPPELVNELKPFERQVFKLLFMGRVYRKIYRLFEFSL